MGNGSQQPPDGRSEAVLKKGLDHGEAVSSSRGLFLTPTSTPSFSGEPRRKKPCRSWRAALQNEEPDQGEAAPQSQMAGPPSSWVPNWGQQQVGQFLRPSLPTFGLAQGMFTTPTPPPFVGLAATGTSTSSTTLVGPARLLDGDLVPKIAMEAEVGKNIPTPDMGSGTPFEG